MFKPRLIIRNGEGGSAESKSGNESSSPLHSSEITKSRKDSSVEKAEPAERKLKVRKTSSKAEPSIISDMEGLPYSDHIKKHANCIFSRFTSKRYRSNRRLMLVFYCLYSTHRELGLRIDPAEIGKAVGISAKDCGRAMSLFSEVQTGYRPPQNTSTPCDFLTGYCHKLDIKSEEAIASVIALSRKLLEKEPSLREDNPQKMAAGILKYWMKTNGVTTKDDKIYAQIVGQSAITIKGIVNKIEIIDNK